MMTYDELESDAIRSCEARMSRRFQRRERGTLKCANAHVLQSIRRHGTDNPAFVRKEAYKSVTAALGIWEVLVPILVPFLKQAIAVLVEYLMKVIDGLNPTDPGVEKQVYRTAALGLLASEAYERWPQPGSV